MEGFPTLKLSRTNRRKDIRYFMGILWIIEKPRKRGPLIMQALQGDFAVRVFGSWGSFVKLGAVHNTTMPDAVVINLPLTKYKIDPVDLYLSDNFSESLRIFLTPPQRTPLLQKPGRFVFDNSFEPFRLSNIIKNLLDVKKGDREFICYRDLRMDTDGLIITHSSTGEEECLTLKEGQLLRYFLKHSGRCIERQELIDAVWNRLKVSPRTIDSQISRLRRRLLPMSVSIDSVYGGGYILK
jgi:hypothetical protein